MCYLTEPNRSSSSVLSFEMAVTLIQNEEKERRKKGKKKGKEGGRDEGRMKGI